MTDTTHFGFEEVPTGEKAKRVARVSFQNWWKTVTQRPFSLHVMPPGGHYM